MSVCLIVPLKSPGKTVQLEDGHTHNGAKIILNDKIPYGNHHIQRQMWFWDGALFRSFANPNKCLSLKGQSTSNGTLIILDDIVRRGTRGNDQEWSIEGDMIINRKAPSMAWNLKDGKTKKGTKIQVWMKRDDEDYSFNVELLKADPLNNSRLRGRCVIIPCKRPSTTIQLEHGKTSRGTRLELCDRIADDDRDFQDQLWLWDGRIFRSGKDPTMCLHLYLGRTTNGTPIELKDILDRKSPDRANQEFYIEGRNIVSRKNTSACWHTGGPKIHLWNLKNHENGSWMVEFLDDEQYYVNKM